MSAATAAPGTSAGSTAGSPAGSPAVDATDVVPMFPIPMKLKVTGKGIDEEIEVTQIYVGQLREVMTACAKFLPLFQKFKGQASKSDMIKDLFMDHADEAVQLIALCLSRPPDWAKRLDIDSALALFMAIVEVNVDFFLQRVLPTMLKAVARMSAFSDSVAKAGLTVSNSSSPKATEITTT